MYRVLYFIVIFKQLKMLGIDYNIIAKLRPLWLFAFPVCASSYYSLSLFFCIRFRFVFCAYLLNCSDRFHSTNINILKMYKREGNTLSLCLAKGISFVAALSMPSYFLDFIYGKVQAKCTTQKLTRGNYCTHGKS